MIRTDKRVARAVEIMESHLADPLAIRDVAARVGVSARHLQGLFHNVLDVGPKQYYLAMRLNLARRRLLETANQISEIASWTGFLSLAAFDQAYARQYGESPSATRRSGRTKDSAGANRGAVE